MNPSLASISISNFRSINGTVTVPLNAPIILIHGPNGAGKTSVLSAIELALTGGIPAMQRSDQNYRSHLIYRGSEQSRIVLDGFDLPIASTLPHETIIRPTGMVSGPLLSEDVARFFSERCYLAQATLGRLLEIYQNANPHEESALTHFVKDLLGLDALDALIDGLHAAADIRNTRRLAPRYADAEAMIKSIDQRILARNSKVLEALTDAAQYRAAVHKELVGLSLVAELESGSALPVNIEAMLNADDERQLIALKNFRRDLTSLQMRAAPLSSSLAAENEAAAILEEINARTDADKWRSSTGGAIEAVIDELRSTFPDLPSVASTDPAVAFETATSRVEAELQRCLRAVAVDDALIVQIEKLSQDVEHSRARIALADEQLTLIAGETEGLSRVLASIIPHIHGDICPVCARNYQEVSKEPLLQHVSAQAARLAEQADRLQGLGQSRATAVADLATSERDRDAAIGKQMSQEGRGMLKSRISGLTEARRRLADVSASVVAGATAIRREAQAQQRLSEIRGRDRLATEIRGALADLCASLEQPSLETSETISAVIERIDGAISTREAAANDRSRRRREALSEYYRLRERETELEGFEKASSADVALKKRWEDAFGVAEQNRQTARTIAKAAASARTAIVGRVFNSSLNKIWRDLFVRLAPTEPFVPAFRLPQTTSEPVTAQLETVHREGGSGGAPGSMLSAGNLNTAALTLFLALHLSVDPQLPWLILDDPVQSMDEVHIAQFAALLRTLSKEHHRRVVIAVHERPLFDYLTLELSPAFAGDQLVTVELSRSNAGASMAEPTYYNWEPDRAVSVA